MAEGTLKMKLSLNIFFFGWWLARQCWTSTGQILSTPLISTNFNRMVALGEKVTITCRSQDDVHGTFYLTRYKSLSDHGETVETKKAELFNQTEFFFPHLSNSQGGIYSCRFCLDEWECSTLSNIIYLNLTDHSLAKPFIQILNTYHPYFDVQCEGREPRLTFALMSSSQQIGYKSAEPGEKKVVFPLSSLRLKKAERYTCQYHRESSPFVWSVPSDPLELPLRDPESMNPTMKTIPGGDNASGLLQPYLWAGIGVSVFLLVVLLLAVVLYRKRRRSSQTNERNPAINLSSDVEEHPDEVSYAILNHQPQKTQQATDPRQTSETCLYASVVKNTGFQPYIS
ncbi:immunoglobulin superfamily member 1-like [Pseudonaja textilis]|uniref:immunoglobulin superfamily member 1-like n=1 Tax=Pseudonaja textilis TaxID=8673 RepID=UPI000EA85730|nr:immunoglobulin superfamily member 1-like [Pseudonaja textilis]